MSRRKAGSGGTRATGDRQEARANRKLQLIVSNSFPGIKGKTLIEQMQDALDVQFRRRKELQQDREIRKNEESRKEAGADEWTDEDENEYVDAIILNKGEIQGMLKMLGIMRSTCMKIELQRAKIRADYKGDDDQEEE